MSKSARLLALFLTVFVLGACRTLSVGPAPIAPITPIAPPADIRDIITVAHIDIPDFDPASITAPQICSQYDSLAEELYMDTDGELTAYLTVQTCGWKDEGVIEVSVTFPNNNRDVTRVNTEVIFNKNFATYTYQWQPGDQVGPYTFSFANAEGRVSQTLHIVEPVGPRIYRLRDGNLMFYQFYAHETVILLKYALRKQEDDASQYQLVAWETVQMDGFGKRLQETRDTSDQFPLYVAVGEQSGEVHLGYPTKQSSIVISP
jgi:hypothetical protein